MFYNTVSYERVYPFNKFDSKIALYYSYSVYGILSVSA